MCECHNHTQTQPNCGVLVKQTQLNDGAANHQQSGVQLSSPQNQRSSNRNSSSTEYPTKLTHSDFYRHTDTTKQIHRNTAAQHTAQSGLERPDYHSCCCVFTMGNNAKCTMTMPSTRKMMMALLVIMLSLMLDVDCVRVQTKRVKGETLSCTPHLLQSHHIVHTQTQHTDHTDTQIFRHPRKDRDHSETQPDTHTHTARSNLAVLCASRACDNYIFAASGPKDKRNGLHISSQAHIVVVVVRRNAYIVHEHVYIACIIYNIHLCYNTIVYVA